MAWAEVGRIGSGLVSCPSWRNFTLTFSLPANSPSFCTSLLSLDLIEPLLHLLSVSNVVSVLVGVGVT